MAGWVAGTAACLAAVVVAAAVVEATLAARHEQCVAHSPRSRYRTDKRSIPIQARHQSTSRRSHNTRMNWSISLVVETVRQ